MDIDARLAEAHRLRMEALELNRKAAKIEEEIKKEMERMIGMDKVSSKWKPVDG